MHLIVLSISEILGYPFVTMGFGFKKYLNYKILSRRRKEVETENELTFNIVNRLHIENINSESLISNHNNSSINHLNNNNEITNEESTNEQNFDQESEDERRISNVDVDAIQIGSSSNLVLIIENIFILMTTYLIAIFRKFLNLTNLNHRFRLLTKSSSDSNSSLIDNNKALDNKILDRLIDKSTDKSTEQISSSIQDNNNSSFLQEEIVTLTPTNCLSSIDQNQQDNNNDTVRSLDKLKKMKQENKNEIKKLKNELQSIKQSELDCKEKLNKMQVSRNEFKFQCNKLQHDNTVLQEKLQNCLNSKQQDKNMINELEKKLQEERKTKQQLEKQVNKYSKVIECGEACKQRRQEFDDCLNQLREELKLKDIQMNKLKEDAFGNKSLLLNALEKMQNRNSQLESNLREETKLKLELFSVLGDTRRQLEVNQLILFQKSNEVEELNCKLSELMAVMPSINTHSDPYGSIFLPNFMNQTVNSAINQTLNLNQNVNQNETVNMVNVTASSSTLNNLNSNLNSNLNNNNIGISKHQSPSSTEYQQSNVRNTVLKNSIVGSRDNLSHKTNLINTSNNNSNNVSTNSNRTSSSSSSIKDASIDWKNLTNSLEHSLESTSGVSSTPKSSNSDL